MTTKLGKPCIGSEYAILDHLSVVGGTNQPRMISEFVQGIKDWP
jgi:hypothetical protein